MLREIRETKARNKDGSYISVLEISGKDFFRTYDSINTEIAEEIINSYLLDREDDGRPENIDFNYDKNNNIISIKYQLNYIGNDHTNY